MACDTRVRDWGKIRQSWYAMVGMKDEKSSLLVFAKKNDVGGMCAFEQ